MYVKIYRYRIQPDKVERYLEIQRQATVYIRDTLTTRFLFSGAKKTPVSGLRYIGTGLRNLLKEHQLWQIRNLS
ncbi:MAG: hypothetical protein V3U74_02920 [Thermodesulfobacteriota bacterium]